MRAPTRILMLLVVAMLFLVQGSFAQGCLSNGRECQPDGSLGRCCSNFCLKREGQIRGNCADSCLARGKECLPDGSLGRCCSNLCLKQPRETKGKCT